MKILAKAKDGGPESTVTGYWLLEIKWLFSIVLLRFAPGTRESYHSHAFNAISWLLRGWLVEEPLDCMEPRMVYGASWRPVITRRTRFHRVRAEARGAWVLSFRGPWAKTWEEWNPVTERRTVLAHGRKEIA